MEQQRRFLVGVLYAAVWLVLGYGVLRWAVPFLAPFLAAFLVAFCLRRPVRFLARTAGISRRPAAGLLLCAVAALVLGSVVFLGGRLLVLGKLALARLPQFYAENCEPLLLNLTQKFSSVVEDSQSVLLDSSGLMESLTGTLQALFSKVASGLGNALAAVPGMVLPFTFACVAAVFFTLDYDRIVAFATARLSPNAQRRLHWVKTQGLQTLAKLLRAYFLLFCLTFAQLLAGLLLLQIPGAPGLSVLIALVDVLPVLGVGTVLLPWAAVCLFGGNTGLGIGLLVLYAVIWVVRQMCEPRLIGKQLGLHPLVSLFFVYAGLRLFGLLGMLVLPCIATLVWQLYRQSRPLKPEDSAQNQNPSSQKDSFNNENEKNDFHAAKKASEENRHFKKT